MSEARCDTPDPVIEFYKQHLDRSLLRENLRRSTSERLENLVALQRFAEQLRGSLPTSQKRR